MARFHKLLRINLTSRSYLSEDIPRRWEKMFLGGKGLATAYLVKEVPKGADPLGPDNKFIITAGPLNGTIAPASSRFEIVTKSPLTGIYLDCNSGGHFGAELKAAGWDMMILEGVSRDPVMLYIENEQVEFIDGSELWGLKVYETEKKVRELSGHPDTRILSIGPAGENLVRFASLSNDFSRNAARGGSGAVLGSKKVKAIAVRGSLDIPMADLPEMRKSVARAKDIIFKNPWVEGQRRYGTVRSLEVVNTAGFLPVNNFSKGSTESSSLLNEHVWDERIGKILSCGECPVACSKGYRRGGMEMEGPEYETVGLFGPNLGIYDPERIAGFNLLCNQYGMDTITAGSMLGALRKTNLFSDRNGSVEDIVDNLLMKISSREGVGELLALGPAAVAEEYDLEESMPMIKGLGFPAYDPRITPGTALAYMTADRGACHLRSWPVGRELSGLWKEDDILGRVEFVKNQQDEKAAEESLIVCQFVYGIGLLNPILAEMVSVSTGESWTLDEMKRAGERCWTLSRVFNCREGIERKDDYLPIKFSTEPLTSKFADQAIGKSEATEKRVTEKDQDFMLDAYYDFRGWDSNGVPEDKLIEELGIGDWCNG
ncbi:MAG: aldehyde ferredoxin oxidoreductase family protein [Spirochaetales bacterium]|nr:aldehyde ferredoxin oxidoreductase family protein [Spirochaetales bacterium]